MGEGKGNPVVLVDDDLDDLLLLQEVISMIDKSQRVVSFQSSHEALNFLRTTADHPLMIISDINMPEMNGLELRRSIYDEEALRVKSIPFIFYSTGIQKKEVLKAYELTVQGFFRKEDSVQEIENTLRELFRYWKRCVHPNSFK